MPRTASRAVPALAGGRGTAGSAASSSAAVRSRPVDAVVRERALQVRHEALGQALGLGVERAQEGVQVLLRAAEIVVQPVGVRPVERAHVGVELEQPALGVGVAAPGTAASARAELVRREVVAEHGPARAAPSPPPSELGRLEARSARPRPAATASSSIGSICSSGLPAGTWALAETSTSRTRPWTVAVSELSIFMLSVTATTSPGCTSSPAATGIATTTPGEWLRIRPPSSREIAVRDAVDLDEQVGVLQRRDRAVRAAAEAQPALVLGQLLDGRLDAGAVDLDAGSGAGRSGRPRSGSRRRGAAGRACGRRRRRRCGRPRRASA